MINNCTQILAAEHKEANRYNDHIDTPTKRDTVPYSRVLANIQRHKSKSPIFSGCSLEKAKGVRCFFN
jgi:hypothetical protein